MPHGFPSEEHPQITGAHSDAEKMGAKAAELLLRAAEPGDESLVDVILPAELTVRETSAPANPRVGGRG